MCIHDFITAEYKKARDRGEMSRYTVTLTIFSYFFFRAEINNSGLHRHSK
jgi:hypothetical protein